MLGKMSGSGFTSGSATYKDMEQGMASRCVYRIFDVSGKSGGAVFTNAVNITDYRREDVIDTVSMQSILPGGAVTNGGRIYIPYSTRDGQGVISAKITDSGIEDWDPQPVSPLLHAETPIVPLVVDAAGAVTAVDVSSADLPGADRPFTVKRDPVKGVYWAVTTPQNASMELYASRDLKTWLHAQTVFTVTDTDTTAVSNPAMEISDGDIAIAFNLCCPDGGPCVLDAERPNYAMFRKVTGFRKMSPIKTGTVISIR